MGLSRLRDVYGDYKLYVTIRDAIPVVSATVLVVYVSGKIIRQLCASYKLKKTRVAAVKKLQQTKKLWRQKVLAQITQEEADKITSIPFNDLVASLRQGHLKAVDVLRAFQYKAAVEDERLNFVAQPLDPVNAEALAKALDDIPVSERHLKPLFGLPLSVKENENMQGYCPTMGCSRRLGRLRTEDSPRVKVLRDSGAIPFILTNIPQALLSFSCTNPIYGETRNPWDPTREPGGSSGGEGAAIAAGASVFGLGSDIGGSLRIPAAWAGIPAIKPTAGRLSDRDRQSSNPGQTAVKATAGPMASTVEGLIMAMRVYSSEEMFYEDPTVAHQPFNEQELASQRPLTIGVFEMSGSIHVCAAAKRAVRETADLLAAKGHKIVPYSLRDSGLCTTKYFPTAMFGDGGSHLCNLLYGDELTADIKPMVTLLSFPHLFKKILNKLIKFLMPKYVADVIAKNEGIRSVGNWFDFMEELACYRHNVIRDWRSEGLDAVLCPAMPVPAMPLGDPTLAKSAVSYTIPWNVLNFPAGVVPVTTVSAEDTADDASNYPRNDMFHKIMKRGLTGSEGLPIAAQLVTLPFQEELCLRLMKEVEAAADFVSLTRRKD